MRKKKSLNAIEFKCIQFCDNSHISSLQLYRQVCDLLKERSKKYSGARVDHNKYCATLHFRCVKEEVNITSIERS